MPPIALLPRRCHESPGQQQNHKFCEIAFARVAVRLATASDLQKLAITEAELPNESARGKTIRQQQACVEQMVCSCLG